MRILSCEDTTLPCVPYPEIGENRQENYITENDAGNMSANKTVFRKVTRGLFGVRGTNSKYKLQSLLQVLKSVRKSMDLIAQPIIVEELMTADFTHHVDQLLVLIVLKKFQYIVSDTEGLSGLLTSFTRMHAWPIVPFTMQQ